MKFQVFGADESTGADRTLIVEAESEKLAYTTAKGKGVLPYEVIPAEEVQSDDAKFPKSQKTRAQRQQEEETFRLIAGGGVILVVALVCTIAWLKLSSRPPDDSDIRPYSSFSSAPASSGPILYPEDPVSQGRESNFANGLQTLRNDAVGAINETVYDRMIKLNIAGDRTGFAALMDEGLVFLLDSGTNVRIIDRGILKTEIKVESGPTRDAT